MERNNNNNNNNNYYYYNSSNAVGGNAVELRNDVELLCKTLQVEYKLFYFDLKENPRGPYLKILEKTSATRSTIIVPFDSISWFLDVFDSYVNSGPQQDDAHGKQIQLDTKVFYFDIGENRRGRCLKTAVLQEAILLPAKISLEANFILKMSEAFVIRSRSTIIIPSGSARDEGLAAFRNMLVEIDEASRLFILPSQVGAGFISGHSSQLASAVDSNVDSSVELPPPDEISKVIRADQKRFFFDLGSNNKGHFLRISEVAGSDRNSIILPLSGLKRFYEMVGYFVNITKDQIEGTATSNVCTVDPPQK